MILAQKLENGEIKYIQLFTYQRETTSQILKTFYSKEERVNALINLGNLRHLGPSPYGEYKPRESDKVHCAAFIRDQKGSRGRNIPKFCSHYELQIESGHIFLYDQGVWQYFNGHEFTKELPAVLAEKNSVTMKGLEYRTLSDSSEITPIYSKNFYSWAEVQKEAKERDKPIFVFRDNQLITTINHPKEGK